MLLVTTKIIVSPVSPTLQSNVDSLEFKFSFHIIGYMESVQPPNYGPQQARFGPRCESCEFFDEMDGQCRKYSFPVKVYMHCDSWKRNPSLPVKVV
jgi:hypothetical protein